MNEQNQHDEIMKAIADINEKLKPIYETYTAWLALGRWGKIVLYLAGAVLGLIVAWKQIFK